MCSVVAFSCLWLFVVVLLVARDRRCVQGASSSLPLSAVIATHEMILCITYKAIQDALREVCMLDTLTLQDARSPPLLEHRGRRRTCVLCWPLVPAVQCTSPHLLLPANDILKAILPSCFVKF
jgi:hypothetical protein